MKLGKLAAAMALVSVAMGGHANAGPVGSTAVIDLTEVGGNVVAIGSGAISLTGLTVAASDTPDIADGALHPSPPPEAFVGLATNIDIYTGAISGPGSLGPGGATLGSSGSGDTFGLSNDSGAIALYVPAGYLSGAPLSGSSTFDNQTFASLGMTPGTYAYHWGSVDLPGSLTINVVEPTVPEPASWALMGLGFAGLAFLGRLASRKNGAVAAPTAA